MIQGVLVQEMVREGFECLVGVKRDPLFGPLVAVGLGGIYAGGPPGMSLRRAPFGLQTAREMPGELKGYPLSPGPGGEAPGRGRPGGAGEPGVPHRRGGALSGRTGPEPGVRGGFQGGGAVAADALVLRR